MADDRGEIERRLEAAADWMVGEDFHLTDGSSITAIRDAVELLGECRRAMREWLASQEVAGPEGDAAVLAAIMRTRGILAKLDGGPSDGDQS